MTEWISVQDKYPENGQKIQIRVWDHEAECDIEVIATFCDTPDYRSWIIAESELKGRNPIARPSHWRVIK